MRRKRQKASAVQNSLGNLMHGVVDLDGLYDSWEQDNVSVAEKNVRSYRDF